MNQGLELEVVSVGTTPDPKEEARYFFWTIYIICFYNQTTRNIHDILNISRLNKGPLCDHLKVGDSYGLGSVQNQGEQRVD